MSVEVKRGLGMAIRWTTGAVVALGLVVLVGGYFLDSYPAAVWSDEVNRRVPPEGAVIQWRREGWGTTRYWKYGISGVDDRCMTAKARVLIWGDSYVEALQVNDADKAAQQATRLWQAQGRDVVALGVGVSGASAADYYFNLERYEQLLGPVPVQVVLVSQLEDYFPDEPTHELARFVSEPNRQFIPFVPPAASPYEATINFHHRYKLAALNQLREEVFGGSGEAPFWRRAKWKMGPRAKAKTGTSSTRLSQASPEQFEAALDFVFAKFREQTARPFLFIYCPAIPRIDQGRILRVDEQAERARQFAGACRRHGFAFHDMGPDFLAFYDATGQFPRGFASTRPGRAHFNPHGHRLVAEAIVHETAGSLDP